MPLWQESLSIRRKQFKTARSVTQYEETKICRNWQWHALRLDSSGGNRSAPVLLLVICGAVLHMFAFTLTHLNHVLYRCTIKTQEKLKGLLTAPFCSGILQLPNKLAVSVRRRLSKMSPDLDPNFDLSLKRKKKKKVIRKIITMIQLIIFPLVHDNQV